MAKGQETTKGGGWFTPIVTALRQNLGAGSGGKNSSSKIIKRTTGLADTVATAVATLTIPNTQHAALINIETVGIMGAGGAVGAGETVKISKYQIALARTAGLAAVATVSSAIGGAQAKVAGADDITSVVVTVSAMTGANSAQQTCTINVAITKAAGAAAAHVALTTIEVINENVSGITVA